MIQHDEAIAAKAVAAQDIKKTGEIERLMRELNEATMFLVDNLYEFSEQLNPVLRNEPAVAGDDVASRAVSTDLGNALMNQIERVHRANAKIRDLRDKVEL